MAMNFVPLDKEKHKDIKIAARPNLEFAKEAHISAASVREFAMLAASMPIVFIEDPNKRFYSVVMLGIEQKQNLFLHDGQWQGSHVPMNLLRYPFDIKPDGDKLGIYIDENSYQITDDGEPLFVDGEPSTFLRSRQQFLTDLANSEMLTQRFVAKLQEHNLLEEINIRIAYQNGEQRNVTGLYSINEKNLLDLSAEAVVDLHKNGFIGAAYTAMVSLGQLNRLVELSNKTENPIQSMQIVRLSEQQNAEGQAAPENA
ncbi:SapC protein [Alteromonas sediminis]|uniref:SapC protein n=1 Tax=Alteromonas sediminis TaxID=2259342 RepID=A0A3N5Y4T7_9ALTE|nr:SapC family protein [Alteromonas sediminis]RPJ67936.1 SapC protein [Alteromonas sediminis]